MRSVVLCGAVWFAISVIVCMPPSEARASKDSSRGKNSKGKNKAAEGDCIIDQDDHGFYFVLCGDAAKKNKARKSSKKNGIDGKQNRGRTDSKDDKTRENLMYNPTTPSTYQKCKCERGKRGPRGNRGRSGSRGKPGKQGPPGPSGGDGRDGRSGLPGLKGPVGVPGRPGLSGLQGLKGDNGNRGIPGITGHSGLPGLIGPPGNCIKKSNVGKVASPLFYCLPGKTGNTGSKGSTGITGPRGPAGPKGNSGQQGKKGDIGQRGRIGKPGPPGDFNNFSCSPRYTDWINVSQWESSQPDVYCDTKEFLQGFRLEKANSRKRYRYICCKLTKKG